MEQKSKARPEDARVQAKACRVISVQLKQAIPDSGLGVSHFQFENVLQLSSCFPSRSGTALKRSFETIEMMNLATGTGVKSAA